MRIDKKKYIILDDENTQMKGRNNDEKIFFFTENDFTCHYGLCKKNGEIICPCIFDDVGIIYEDKFWCKLKEKWGVMKTNGVWYVKPRYVGVHAVMRLLVMKDKNDKYGAIDYDGNIVLDYKYTGIVEEKASRISDYGTRFAVAYLRGTSLQFENDTLFLLANEDLDFSGPYINAFGKELVESYVYHEHPFFEWNGFFIIQNEEEKYGVWNTYKGKETIPCQYDDYAILNKSADEEPEPGKVVIGLKQDGKWGLFTCSGRMWCEPTFDGLDDSLSSHHYLIAALLNDKWGFINVHGTVKIPFKFYGVEPFGSIDFTSTKVYLDRDGEVISRIIDTHGNYIDYKDKKGSD